MPRLRSSRYLLERLDLTQMVMDIQKQLKSTYFIIPNNFCFNNLSKKSIPGDARAQVLQEPVGASHADQGRKSEMLHPFLDPGGRDESNGTPHLGLAPSCHFPQGGVVVGLYNKIYLQGAYFIIKCLNIFLRNK